MNLESPEGPTSGTVRASPVARRLAEDLGLDLATVRGTGPRGRIVRSDIEAAGAGVLRPDAEADPDPCAAPAPAAPAPASGPGGAKGVVETVALRRVQQVVARRMVEAKAEVPEFALVIEVDMTRCLALRAELKDAPGLRPPSVNDLIVKASALALREHPMANGAYCDGHFELYSRVNVGVAVASPDALLVPTVFDADTKPLHRIAAETRALAERARTGAIEPSELAGGTFTVSNLGMFGIRRFTAVINPPQAAILAVGATVERMRVHEGAPAVRSVMDMTLTCDHRILYGADAARFLARIRERLETPAALLFGDG